MKNNKKQVIAYHRDKEGQWYRSVWQHQCPDKDLFRNLCQGVSGHKGCHWAYRPDGSYAYWKNESDPGAIDDNTAAGLTPPGHKSYVNPVDKVNEHHTKFYSTSKVVDGDVIQGLENNEAPEEHATIDRPLSPEEEKKLREKGILPEE